MADWRNSWFWLSFQSAQGSAFHQEDKNPRAGIVVIVGASVAFWGAIYYAPSAASAVTDVVDSIVDCIADDPPSEERPACPWGP